MDHNHVVATPEKIWRYGPLWVLEHFSRLFGVEGVLLLDRFACGLLGIADDLSILDFARNLEIGDWRIAGKIGPWTTMVKGPPTGRPDHTIHLFMEHLVDRQRFPMWAPQLGAQTAALAKWHAFTGRSYHGTPGVAGLSLIREHVPDLKTHITWKHNDLPFTAAESPYVPRQWGVASDGPEIGIDANRMHLAAAELVSVSPWNLKHTGRCDFDRSRAGWWKIEVPPWNIPELPHPVGYPWDVPIRWVTTPTMGLLTELQDQGVIGRFEIHDSWTGPGMRLLRKWARTLEDAYEAFSFMEYEVDIRLRDTVGPVYKETIGLLNHKDDDGNRNAIFWPHAHHSIIALGRCNLWRKLWRAYQRHHVIPLRIDVDHITFPGTELPLGFNIGTRLGEFKVKELKGSESGEA